MPDSRPRGLLDTSVLIGLSASEADRLPSTMSVSAISIAELAAGPHATSDPAERARRQDRLQRVESAFEPLPFDAGAARAYGEIYAAIHSSGRKVRGRRADDLLIAAIARSQELPLYTRNPGDFAGLDDLIDVVVL